MTHRYAFGRDHPDGFAFTATEVEGDFDLRLVEGRARPVIVGDGGDVVIDPANEVYDRCVDDYRIPLWAGGQVVNTAAVAGAAQLWVWGRDGPEAPQPTTVGPVPQYVFIRAELRAGRPHPGAPGGLR